MKDIKTYKSIEDTQDTKDIKDMNFSSKNPIKTISTIDNRAVIRTNLILNHIKNNPMITPYKIRKDLSINYTTISRTIKELIFCNAISFKVEIGENNRTHKLLFVPEEKKNDKMIYDKENKDG